MHFHRTPTNRLLASPSLFLDSFGGADKTLGLTSLNAAVPEPSTLALAAFGLLGLAAWRYRRRRA